MNALTLNGLLAEALGHLRSNDPAIAGECIRRAQGIVGGAQAGLSAARSKGGLSPRAARDVRIHIEDNLAGALTVRELASLTGASPSHFSRSFRASFGVPLHRYVIERRLERAREMMLSTDLPLCAVALECGLADQAHLSRLFKESCGETPGAWRRARSARAGLSVNDGPIRSPRRAGGAR